MHVESVDRQAGVVEDRHQKLGRAAKRLQRHLGMLRREKDSSLFVHSPILCHHWRKMSLLWRALKLSESSTHLPYGIWGIKSE
jgi:hypothetical protein